ncbi:MAG: methylornithine synthase PylB [Deltaproteobacteria bacterium]|nr:methylornithine synthase PylB [Deltaproteobacteria bacterium]
MQKEAEPRRIEDVIRKAHIEQRILPEEIKILLSLKDVTLRELLFQMARSIRDKYFGKKIFLYGFIYFSTYCKNSCTFCLFRMPNALAPRYRKNANQILETAKLLADSGVNLIDLTMGEDPTYATQAEDDSYSVAGIVRQVKAETNLPIMISPGVVSRDRLSLLKDAGADWYACYQETHNRKLFSGLRPEQSYDERLMVKHEAHSLGLLIEEGILSCVGETVDDLTYSISMMQSLNADQVRIMTFIPQSGTPMGTLQPNTSDRELLLIALMRLIFPDRLIPASLDLRGLNGLKERLDAGANVVTSVIQPEKGWAGVAHNRLDIENSNRTTQHVQRILESCGLQPGSQEDYLDWLEKRKILFEQNKGDEHRCSMS